MLSSQSSRTTKSRDRLVLFSMSTASSLKADHSAQATSTSISTAFVSAKLQPIAA